MTADTDTSLQKSNMAQLARVIKILMPFDLVKPLLGIVSKEIITVKQKAISVKTFAALLSIIAKI